MDARYLAGLVDGEGYLGLIPCKKVGSTNTSYQCVLKLCLTGLNAEKVTRMIADQYQGHLYKRSKPTGTGKDVFTVEIKSKPRLKLLLDDIQPHLLVKKEQAELMRRFIELPMLHPKHTSFSQKLFDERLAIVQSLKALTQRIPLAETK